MIQPVIFCEGHHQNSVRYKDTGPAENMANFRLYLVISC